MNGVPVAAVSNTLTSIHPDTQGLHCTLMGRDGKPVEGIWRMRVEAKHERWEPHRQAICQDKEVPFPSSPLRPSMSSTSRLSPLHSTAMPSLLTDPTPATVFCTLHDSTVSPRIIVSVHIIRWRTEAEIDFIRGK